MVAWHTAPVKTFAEAKQTPLIIGAAAFSSVGTKFGAVTNNLLGTKFKSSTGIRARPAQPRHGARRD